MVEKVDKIWMDGKFVNWDDANVHILTHTLHYGLGVFEGVRCYELADGGSAIFRLKEHTKRLYESSHMFQLEVPFTQDQINEACLELFRVNKLKAGYLRPLVYIGAGAMGLYYPNNPICVSLIAWPWGTYLGDEGVKNGIRAKISSFTRLAMNVNLPKSKACGNYINSMLAKREALAAGYEEAILLDQQGFVSEASGENIFLIKDGTVYTPPTSSSMLKGITRDTILTILRDEGIPIVEDKFAREEAYTADELFLSGTAAEVCPIRELDNRKIGSGKPGDVTRKVQKIYFDTIKGKVDKYSHWLERI